MIELRVAAAEGALETQLTLSGLVPNLEYHLYTDSLENHSLMTADEAGGLSWVQDLVEPHVLFIQTVPSTSLSSRCERWEWISKDLELATTPVRLPLTCSL